MGFEDWERWEQVVAIIFIVAVVIAIIGIIWFVSQDSSPEIGGSPQLSFSLPDYSGNTSDKCSTYLNVVNSGNETNGIDIIIESDAFEQITLPSSVDIPAGGTKRVPIEVTVRDVNNQYYPVTVTYSCNGMSDEFETTEQFYVIPDMDLIEVNYLDPVTGMEIGDGNNIDQQGEKELSFKVKSNSENAVYDDLYAVLVVEEITDTITITPSKLDVGSMGPKGQSENPYPFTIKTNLTPEGTYNLTVVLYSNGHVVASKLRTLDVV